MIQSHRLPAKSRPAEVSLWMRRRKYTDDAIPHIEDVSEYRKSWTGWWMDSQPPWRLSEQWPLPKEPVENATWGKLSARGQSGLFLVIMSTAWWASSLQSADHRRFFDEAVDDVRWVIEQQLKTAPVPKVPPVDKPLGAVENLPAQAKYLQRGEGKRKAKPSAWLLGR